MDEKFRVLIEGLSQKYNELISMEPVSIDTSPPDTPKGGVYLFYENEIPMYAGRTKLKIRVRLKNHVSSADDCPLAWRLARESTGKKATYQWKGSRKHLLQNPAFKEVYDEAKQRIRQMGVRYVGEDDPLKQALLEIYVAVVSGAKHNDFDTH
ncbi:MAG: hypothetical protein FVQ79_13505 [Planctomycetes bacterium]|nr:hypothetical protein [Planctomycetota bacterium]